ncbi:hypothetical protein BH09SUM1_BH09SUM1_16210 [soil metagenome]
MKTFLAAAAFTALAASLVALEPPVATSPALAVASDAAIVAAVPGGIVSVPELDTKKIAELDYEKMVLPGPQFLISDDPEYIRVPEGVGLRERVEAGRVRLYLYNVNGIKEAPQDTHVGAVIRNLGDGPLTVRFLNFASEKPSGNYYAIGKGGLRDFLSGGGLPAPIVVAAGESASLDPKLDAGALKSDDLAHGFYEFLIDQPAEISVLQAPFAAPLVEANGRLTEVLPPSKQSGAGRGLYPISNYRVRLKNPAILDTAAGAVQLTVADGEKDAWITGFDSPTQTVSTLKGNYGVMYDIDIDWTSSDGRGLALLMYNARAGGKWCDYIATSLKVSENDGPAEVVVVPTVENAVKAPPDMVLVHLFKPGANKGGKIHITYSPPGASCLPTPLLFMPVGE